MDETFYRVITKAGKGRYIVNETEFEEVIDGFLKTRSRQELTYLLKDILTIREQAELIRRWLVGRMLFDGVKYEEIIERTGMSSTTIAEISDTLFNSSGVFSKILERTPHKVNDAERAARRKQAYERNAARSPVDRQFRRPFRWLDD